MRNKLIALFVFYMLGTGVALANCEYAWRGCTACPEGGNNYKASKFFFGSKCFVCSTVRCNGAGIQCNDEMDDASLSKERSLIDKKVDEILKDLNPKMIILSNSANIALEMAEEHPHAASFIYSAYVISNNPEVGLPEKFTVWGEGVASEYLFSAFKVKEFINKHNNNIPIKEGEYESKNKENRIRTDYEFREMSNGLGYMNIEVSTADSNYKETGKILPNIRVNFRYVERDEGGYWEPTGWQAY